MFELSFLCWGAKMSNLFMSEHYFKSKVSTQPSPLNHLLTLCWKEILFQIKVITLFLCDDDCSKDKLIHRSIKLPSWLCKMPPGHCIMGGQV